MGGGGDDFAEGQFEECEPWEPGSEEFEKGGAEVLQPESELFETRGMCVGTDAIEYVHDFSVGESSLCEGQSIEFSGVFCEELDNGRQIRLERP